MPSANNAKFTSGRRIPENPYFHRAAIKPDKQQYFFGRKEDIRFLLDALARGQCVSILGPRRIGKTSLLRRLQSSLVRTEYGLGDDHLLVYIDCEGLGKATLPAIYQFLSDEVTDQLRGSIAAATRQTNAGPTRMGRYNTGAVRELLSVAFSAEGLRLFCYDHPAFRPVYEQFTPEMNKGQMVQLLIEFSDRKVLSPELLAAVQQVNPRQYERFEGQLYAMTSAHSHRTNTPNLSTDEGAAATAFCELLRGLTGQGVHTVVLFDEFETLASNPQLGKEFFDKLRSLSHVYNVVYVTSSHSTLYEATYQNQTASSSSFFNSFQRRRLCLMKPDEANELINGPALLEGRVAFTDQEVEFLLDVAGLHPFFLNIACFHLFAVKVGVMTSDYEQAYRLFAEEAEDHFDYTWRDLSDREKALLKDIASNSAPDPPEVEKRGLAHKCLLDDRGNLFSSAFAEFVRRQARPSLVRDRTKQTPYLAYELGLERMKARLGLMQTDIFLDFLGLEQRLLETLDDERRFGPDGSIQVEQRRVIRELNRLGHRRLGVSFNDLCRVERSQRSSGEEM